MSYIGNETPVLRRIGNGRVRVENNSLRVYDEDKRYYSEYEPGTILCFGPEPTPESPDVATLAALLTEARAQLDVAREARQEAVKDRDTFQDMAIAHEKTIDALKTEVGTLKTEVGTLKTEVGTLKTEKLRREAVVRRECSRLALIESSVAGVRRNLIADGVERPRNVPERNESDSF